MLEEFRKVAGSVTAGTPQVPMMRRDGALAQAEELCGAEYWVATGAKPVRFGRRAECLR